MAVIIHQKDGTAVTVSPAASVQPWPNNVGFVQFLSAQSTVVGIASVEEFTWVEVQ